jgi:hypothetical protein
VDACFSNDVDPLLRLLLRLEKTLEAERLKWTRYATRYAIRYAWGFGGGALVVSDELVSHYSVSSSVSSATADLNDSFALHIHSFVE